MSRTTVKNPKTGESFPQKSDKRKYSARNQKKFMGFRNGDGHGSPGSPDAKKGKDFVNYGYPMEIRHKSEIRQHIQDELTAKELEDIL